MSISIPHSYMDQLISENWVEYSEKALSGAIPPEMLQGRSFQDVISSNNSNDRTRAKELFEIGVLRGQLIKSRSSSVDAPLGWELVLGNSHVHTRLGYVAYAIGKGLKAYPLDQLPENLRKALSSISTIFLLQLGISHQGKHLLIAGLFKYILEYFRKPIDIEKVKWQRYVAVAMFCTLHNDQYREALLEAYIQNEPVEKLVVIQNNRVDEVNPKALSAMARENRSISQVTPPKASLFWVGDYSRVSPRGIYSVGLEQGADLLSYACTLERESFSSNQSSPFEALLDKSDNTYVIDVLNELGKIFGTNKEISSEWRRIMKNIYDGVREAMRFLDPNNIDSDLDVVFYGHDISDYDENALEIVLRVEAASVAKKPEKNDFVILGSTHFQVVNFQEEGEYYKLHVKKLD